MEAYRAESREIMAIVQEFAGELIQQVSVDEAYVEVSAPHQAATADESLERARPLARKIKAVLQERRQLTASDRHRSEQVAREARERLPEAGRIDTHS